MDLKDVKWGLCPILFYSFLGPWPRWLVFVWAKEAVLKAKTLFSIAVFNLKISTLKTELYFGEWKLAVTDLSQWTVTGEVGRSTRVSGCGLRLTLALLVLLVKQICGLWPGLPWEGGNTAVFVSNFDLWDSSLEVLWLVCSRWEVGCVSCCGGGGDGIPPSSGRAKALIGTCGSEPHFSSPHVLFPRSFPLPWAPALPPFLAVGTLGAAGRKLPFLIFFILFVPSQADICQDPTPNHICILQPAWQFAPRTWTPVWNTGWCDCGSCWPSVHRGLGTDSPRLENPKKALGDLCYLAAAPSTSHCDNWALFMKMNEGLKPGASTPWTELPLEIHRLPDFQG